MRTINVLKVGYLVLLKLRVTLLCYCICVLLVICVLFVLFNSANASY